VGKSTRSWSHRALGGDEHLEEDIFNVKLLMIEQMMMLWYVRIEQMIR